MDGEKISILEEIAYKYDNGASIQFLAREYGFSNSFQLRMELEKYYKEYRNMKLPKQKDLSDEDKDEIVKLYFQGWYPEQIANKYGKSLNYISGIIKKKKKDQPYLYRDINTVSMEKVIEDIKSGISINQVANSNYISSSALTHRLKQTEEGKRAIELARSRAANRKIELDENEVIEAYKTGETSKLHCSDTTWRKVLKEKIGLDYVEKLRPQPKKASSGKKKKVLTEHQFNESLKVYSLQELLDAAERRNIEVPDKFIKKYREENNIPSSPSNLDTPGDDEWQI